MPYFFSSPISAMAYSRASLKKYNVGFCRVGDFIAGDQLLSLLHFLQGLKDNSDTDQFKALPDTVVRKCDDDFVLLGAASNEHST